MNQGAPVTMRRTWSEAPTLPNMAASSGTPDTAHHGKDELHAGENPALPVCVQLFS